MSEEQINFNFRLADRADRFMNLLIDTFGFFFILFLHAMLFSWLPQLAPKDGSPSAGYFIFVLFCYYVLTECFFGKTPAKFLTKTIVVDINSNRPPFLNLLLRNAFSLLMSFRFYFQKEVGMINGQKHSWFTASK